MAAATGRRLLSVCRHLEVGLGISRILQPSWRVVGGVSSIFLNGMSRTISERSFVQQQSFFHSSAVRNGLEEFFDDPKNWGETSVKSGDSWTIEQLRGKSSEDLHKLWYVLLKEKNMLLTLEQESKRQRMAMPGADRLSKVENSMEKIDTVVKEREDSLRLLQTGQEKPLPGDWRKNVFGQTIWYTYKEWPMPWYMNKGYKKKKFFALPYVDHYIRLKIEKELRIKARKKQQEKEKRIDLEKRFPHQANKA
ncbi:large ribosomal subunit protein uL29m [Pelodytes ibericus]